MATGALSSGAVMHTSAIEAAADHTPQLNVRGVIPPGVAGIAHSWSEKKTKDPSLEGVEAEQD